MIRREEPETTWVIHQAAHAAIAGQIAGHWIATSYDRTSPLDAPLTVWIEARPVCGGPFAGDADLQAALCHAPYQPLMFEFCPLEPTGHKDQE